MRCARKCGLILVLCLAGLSSLSAPQAEFHHQPGGAKEADVRSLWDRFKKTLPPFTFQILRDELVRSDTDPRLQLRRLEIKFYSQEINGEKWGHPSVLFMPADSSLLARSERRGKVVVVGQRSIDNLATGSWRDSFLGNYGEPIAARTGYPTMVLPVPGEYDKAPGKEISIGFLNDLVAKTGDPADHNYFRLAIPYLRALDVLERILEVPKVQAVIGGHSKRATSAFTAAAMDPERVVGVVYMGNESVFRPLEQGALRILSPFHSQKLVRAKVLYLGATNEDGYEMFNINRIQARMERPWAIEYIPNYRHADQSEKHFLDWQMWVAHIFDGRPLTTITDLSYEDTDEGTLFRARVESANRIIQAKVWYAYCNDPYWRDVVWYAEFMDPKANGIREGLVTGKRPDAWLVEVKDTGGGYAGYVSTLPQDISKKPTRERVSRGSRPKDWEPKKPSPK
jgi:hypothetical protein